MVDDKAVVEAGAVTCGAGTLQRSPRTLVMQCILPNAGAHALRFSQVACMTLLANGSRLGSEKSLQTSTGINAIEDCTYRNAPFY